MVFAQGGAECVSVDRGRDRGRSRRGTDATGGEWVGGLREAARLAWWCFGKGNHPAGLNFGDCFAYALAKTTGEPLFFKGDDFALTDIEVA